MNINWQDFVVYAAIAVAALFLVKRFLIDARRRKGSCANCGVQKSIGESQANSSRPAKADEILSFRERFPDTTK